PAFANPSSSGPSRANWSIKIPTTSPRAPCSNASAQSGTRRPPRRSASTQKPPKSPSSHPPRTPLRNLDASNRRSVNPDRLTVHTGRRLLPGSERDRRSEAPTRHAHARVYLHMLRYCCLIYRDAGGEVRSVVCLRIVLARGFTKWFGFPNPDDLGEELLDQIVLGWSTRQRSRHVPNQAECPSRCCFRR